MIRYLKHAPPPRHAPHDHRCRDCENIHRCADADRCDVPLDWLCATCTRALDEQQANELARYYGQDADPVKGTDQ
jgi:hypothetical protein